MEFGKPFGVCAESNQNAQPYCQGAPLFPAHLYNPSSNASQPYEQGAPLFPASTISYSSISSASLESVQSMESAQEPTIFPAATNQLLNQIQLVPFCSQSKKNAPKKSQWSRLVERAKPLNAEAVLRNLCGVKMPEFTVHGSNGSGTLAQIVINGMQYQATAPNEYMVKDKLSEEVLCDIFLPHLATRPEKPAWQNDERMDESETSYESFLALHLISFALHNLFTEWNMKPKTIRVVEQPSAPSPTNVIKCREKLPDNPSQRHPVQLLTQMIPSVLFEDAGRTVDAQEQVEFVAQVKVGEQCFFGYGKSKKKARKGAAAEACKALFGVCYNNG